MPDAERHANPFAPPAANLEEVGVGPEDQFVLRYELGRFLFAAWQVQHVFLRPTVHLGCIAFAALVALGGEDTSARVGVFLVGYVIFTSLLCASVFLAACIGRNPRLFTQHVVTLQPEGLAVETHFGKSLHYWRGIERVRSGVFFVAIYVHASAVQLVASSAFVTPSQQEQFVALVRSRSSGHG